MVEGEVGPSAGSAVLKAKTRNDVVAASRVEGVSGQRRTYTTVKLFPVVTIPWSWRSSALRLEIKPDRLEGGAHRLLPPMKPGVTGSQPSGSSVSTGRPLEPLSQSSGTANSSRRGLGSSASAVALWAASRLCRLLLAPGQRGCRSSRTLSNLRVRTRLHITARAGDGHRKQPLLP